ncbi:MAG: hypothetical protein JNL98_05670 [Bryobacterales bacterium]|nr:hypothetical protein [Bryobacterales bacterium]
MIVAVAGVRVMKVSVHQIIDVVAMGHGLMTTVRAMDVISGVRGARMSGGASRGVGGAHFHDVLIGMIAMRGVEVPVVQVVYMISVLHRGVTAAFAMDVRMIFVNFAGHRK